MCIAISPRKKSNMGHALWIDCDLRFWVYEDGLIVEVKNIIKT